ncbi:MAG: hypothetical protein AVDCRST_MAG90-805 [uncultured Microvirga sp.]|uniref:Uncharacterized protein n=1 Tax=uncultured Microvirga sp. TaxID=412392 RepID=A0A6J4KXG6_9HYPH|nr:MAG: hypothetical protein AVDCRST_MAG90-805 [uncultured Microvirga sp.]
MDTPDPVASERKLRAKRYNERVKLGASFLNTLSLAIWGAAFVIPGVLSFEGIRWTWIPVAVILTVLAQVALGLLKSED